jgi:hypothetical protein
MYGTEKDIEAAASERRPVAVVAHLVTHRHDQKAERGCGAEGARPAPLRDTQGLEARPEETGARQRCGQQMVDKIIRCAECGVLIEGQHFMCDEDTEDKEYCPECFDNHPCGLGEHGEGCSTMVTGS